MSAPAEKNLPVPVSTTALIAASAATAAKACCRPTRSACPSALTGGLFMRMTAISPSFSVSTIATVHTPLFVLCCNAPGLARGLRQGYSAATKHTRRNAHAARIDDGPAAVGFERDRLCRRGVPERRDRFPDPGGRPPPLWLCPSAPAHRPARERPARAWGEGG